MPAAAPARRSARQQSQTALVTASCNGLRPSTAPRSTYGSGSIRGASSLGRTVSTDSRVDGWHVSRQVVRTLHRLGHSVTLSLGEMRPGARQSAGPPCSPVRAGGRRRPACPQTRPGPGLAREQMYCAVTVSTPLPAPRSWYRTVAAWADAITTVPSRHAPARWTQTWAFGTYLSVGATASGSR